MGGSEGSGENECSKDSGQAESDGCGESTLRTRFFAPGFI